MDDYTDIDIDEFDTEGGVLSYASVQAGLPRSSHSELPDGTQMFKDIIRHRGWDIRDGQLSMVEAIDRDIQLMDINGSTPGTYLSDTSVMAPVGTGKTLGYAIPAIASRRKAIFCTSNRALQDQIITKDGPELTRDVQELYGLNIKFSVLKGKSNYACPWKIDHILSGRAKSEDDDSLFADLIDDTPASNELVIDDWTRSRLIEIKERTELGIEQGDSILLDCGDLIQSLPYNVASLITASSKCPSCSGNWVEPGSEDDTLEYRGAIYGGGQHPNNIEVMLLQSDCGFRTAYLLALQADIAVINTSLLTAEMNKSQSVSERQPTLVRGAGLVVIDEAHHLERIVTDSMKRDISSQRIANQAEKIAKRAKKVESSDKLNVDRYRTYIEAAANAMSTLAEVLEDETQRSEYIQAIAKANEVIRTTSMSISDFLDANRNLKETREYKRIRSISYDIYHVREELFEFYIAITNKKFDDFFEVDRYGFNFEVYEEDGGAVTASATPFDLSFFRNQLAEVMNTINWFYVVSAMANTNTCAPETGEYNHERYQRFLDSGSVNSSLVLCSGTITKNTITTVGMDPQSFFNVPSPFNPLRSRIYIPSGLPNPNDSDYMDEAYNEIYDAIQVADGRTLVLTTSYMAITGKTDSYGNTVFEGWGDRIARDFGDEHTVLVQGNGMTRSETIERFKQDESSILVATLSYWEGVDVPGTALNQVILHKAPFPTQEDAVFNTRAKWVEEHGGNAFNDVTVNYAQIHLGQGAGRLVRAESDLGGIVLLDSRYWNARYGKKLLRLLPQDTLVTSNKRAYKKWMRWVLENPAAPDEELPEPTAYWATLNSHDPNSSRTRRRARNFR